MWPKNVILCYRTRETLLMNLGIIECDVMVSTYSSGTDPAVPCKINWKSYCNRFKFPLCLESKTVSRLAEYDLEDGSDQAHAKKLLSTYGQTPSCILSAWFANVCRKSEGRVRKPAEKGFLLWSTVTRQSPFIQKRIKKRSWQLPIDRTNLCDLNVLSKLLKHQLQWFLPKLIHKINKNLCEESRSMHHHVWHLTHIQSSSWGKRMRLFLTLTKLMIMFIRRSCFAFWKFWALGKLLLTGFVDTWAQLMINGNIKPSLTLQHGDKQGASLSAILYLMAVAFL